MSRRGFYAVRLTGLGDGEHDFSFELDQQFFTLFDHPEVENGLVKATVILEKKPGILALHFSLQGEVEVICDRCLTPFMAPVDSVQDIYVKTGDEFRELEDNVIMINEDDHEIDVSQYLYEYVVLSLPMQKIHPSDAGGLPGCDPDMLDRLDEFAVRRSEDEQETDPRWDALKGIFENNN